MKKTQKQRVVDKLLRDGFVTRNECLRNYISRLSAIIQDLEEEGFEFKPYDFHGDYRYDMIKCPYKTITYTLQTGETITRIQK